MNSVQSNEISNKSRIFSRSNIIFYILSIIIIVLVFFHLAEIKAVSRLFSSIRFTWLILAALAQVCTYLSLSYVYRVILLTRHINNKIIFKKIFSMTFLSVFLNHVLPSGGVSGNLFIFRSISKTDVPKSQAGSLVVIESITMYIAYLLIILIILGSFILFHHGESSLFFVAFIVGCIFYVTLTVVMTFIGSGKLLSSSFSKISKFSLVKKFLDKWRLYSDDSVNLKNPWKIIWENPGITFTAILFQIILFFFDAATVYALFQGFHTDISFWTVLIGFVPTTIIGGLPISPGSLLFYESGMTFFYTALGVPLSAALVITLLYRALSFWLTMPIGLLVYRKLKSKHIIRQGGNNSTP